MSRFEKKMETRRFLRRLAEARRRYGGKAGGLAADGKRQPERRRRRPARKQAVPDGEA